MSYLVEARCQKGTKFGILIEGALLYTSPPRLVNIGPGRPLWRQNSEVKGIENGNAFLVHHLADSDEIWHG